MKKPSSLEEPTFYKCDICKKKTTSRIFSYVTDKGYCTDCYGKDLNLEELYEKLKKQLDN